MIPSYIKYIGSGILTVMILTHYFKKFYFDNIKKNNKIKIDNKIRLYINGMSCMHCASSVKKAVEAIPATSNVYIDLKGKYVEFNIEDEDKINIVKDSIITYGFEIV